MDSITILISTPPIFDPLTFDPSSGPINYAATSPILSENCSGANQSLFGIDFVFYVDGNLLIGVPDPFHCILNLLALLANGELIWVCGEILKIPLEHINNCEICQQITNKSKDLFWLRKFFTISHINMRCWPLKPMNDYETLWTNFFHCSRSSSNWWSLIGGSKRWTKISSKVFTNLNTDPKKNPI
jgi:hypothetical protein